MSPRPVPAAITALRTPPTLSRAIERAKQLLFSLQRPDGYWWFTLEANETIGSGYIQLSHFLRLSEPAREEALLRHILSEQQSDGSWGLYAGAPGDLSTTVEAYLALRLGGHSANEEPLCRARTFILGKGGLAKIRIFTRIHLALFGLVPWSICPAMPIWLILLPPWSGFSIYEFSSWARASIVPLLIILDKKPIHPVSFDLQELSTHPLTPKDWNFQAKGGWVSLEKLFIEMDRALKWFDQWPWHPGKKQALASCEHWVRDHLERTEDIYPALAYGALALSSLGYPKEDPHIQKAFTALKKFQQTYKGTLPPVVSHSSWEAEPLTHPKTPSSPFPKPDEMRGRLPRCDAGVLKGYVEEPPRQPTKQIAGFEMGIHQQCCISPLWDTPWAITALLRSGGAPGDPSLQKGVAYLISQQITDFRGDWAVKNPRGRPGGWAFEFQNDYFPDIDDTIQILEVIRQVNLPAEEKGRAIERGLAWLLSMQSKNGGWGAFDKNNLSTWVNRIPFSDHGACLDPPTPDITGRMVGLLTRFGYKKDHPVIRRALRFLKREQRISNSIFLETVQKDPDARRTRSDDAGVLRYVRRGGATSSTQQVDFPDGRYTAWWGRWGVNYIYGTWCVLQGLAAIGVPPDDPMIARAVRWLKKVQCDDGGWEESCAGYEKDCFVPLDHGIPSQTAWALLGLLAAGEQSSPEVNQGIDFLLRMQQSDGSWDEPEFTGTGFPGHFFIRYHGYRYYFPLLALGTYAQTR